MRTVTTSQYQTSMGIKEENNYCTISKINGDTRRRATTHNKTKWVRKEQLLHRIKAQC
jgi:hypothetical protein